MSDEKNTPLTHFDSAGKPRMVDVTEKSVSARTAVAMGGVEISKETLAIVLSGDNEKGDAVSVAELAGIMAAKRTSDLIPLCHPLPISGVKMKTKIDKSARRVVFTATVKTNGQTGVEMEALTAVSVACLTLYDMLKAADKSMTIRDIILIKKTGGASGDYARNVS